MSERHRNTRSTSRVSRLTCETITRSRDHSVLRRDMSTMSYGNTEIQQRRLLSASIILLAAAAWIALGFMGASMHHEVSGVHAHHHGMPATPPPLQMALFVTSWMVMTIAMMLPTTLPV